MDYEEIHTSDLGSVNSIDDSETNHIDYWLIRALSWETLLCSLLVFVLIRLVLKSYGFGSGGVIRDTFASNYQRFNPIIRSGSWFSTLQSFGTRYSYQMIVSYFITILVFENLSYWSRAIFFTCVTYSCYFLFRRNAA